MNKVVAFLFGLVCFSSHSFAATVPKPYVPDEPVAVVKSTPATKPAAKEITVIKRPVKKAATVAKTGAVKPLATKTKKTAKSVVKKKTTVTKLALNSTQRVNKYNQTQNRAKSRQLAQKSKNQTARISSRAHTVARPALVANDKPQRINTIPLDRSGPSLDSNAALIMNADTGRMVYGKNAARRTPIASITKLMTAMVVLDAGLSMNQPITISNADVDRVKKSSSRLEIGTTLSRYDIMWLALMSSENRAAHSLARTYPGGKGAFIAAMNRKARALGMRNTVFYDSTGLNKNNTSTAADLALMVQAAYRYPQIRQLSTSTEHDIISASGRPLHYQNSNALVREGAWDIGLSKTGYIREAGRCLVMVADVQNKPMVMVFLDAGAPSGRINDARNLKSWLERQPVNRLG
ncbi:D-alanyl-D-alanine carboxypeptidase family protein [Tolumonas osonensis]|uniref:D-alanyl-D-alanine endopeptidase (Penicillin-binding protein 7) n=1 Tax=Tolumonas osonensis TaxID=675874 RepID=A0A841GP86_9GAMM|nr:serine hydrolase [Tolumonas osonensis]MBB6056660.1 D-alanyl-D-alanine endopeptidase (penicillin-binding protein 7) [Tolumonas osonensis]